MDWNFCPVCGHRIYQHQGPATFTGKWDGGCTHVETTGHVLKVTKTGWTIKHPVSERDSDKLFECTVHQEISDTLTADRLKPGEYAVVDSEAGLGFADANQARTQCDCTVPYGALREHRV
jgi:hypothetical protein